ncbi:MAG TPA: UbiA family prenyltransferase [Beijerinckiaceae bacterium]
MEDAVPDSGPFVTSFVIYALCHVDLPGVDSMKEAGLAFLESEKEFGGVWRYYGRTQYKHTRIPPDLDDTACASFVLQAHKRRLYNRWIFRANRDDQGRFLTWIAPKPDAPILSPLRVVALLADLQASWAVRNVRRPAVATDPRLLLTDRDAVDLSDADPAVAANAILYVGESSDTLPAIAWLIEKIGGRDPSFSLYYKDPLTLCYMAARACRHSAPTLVDARSSILQTIGERASLDGTFGSELSTALAACTLLTLDPSSPLLEPAIAALLASQRPDGSWPASAFYSGPTEYWGSPELTTAFCLEAVARWRSSSAGIRAGFAWPPRPQVATAKELRPEARAAGWARSLAIRWDEWWFHKIPFCILVFSLFSPALAGWHATAGLVALVATVCAVANYGHAINELFDRSEDAAAGKTNYATTVGVRRVASAAVICAGAAATLSYLVGGAAAAAATLGALALPAMYSIRPVRLKARRWWGLAADAGAAHVYPAALALMLASPERRPAVTWAAVLVWSSAAGLRNIIMHQFWSEERDRCAGLSTVVHALGGERIALLIRTFLLPVEICSFFAVVALAGSPGWVWAATAVYLIKECMNFAAREKGPGPGPAAIMRADFMNNGYYLVWAPLGAFADQAFRGGIHWALPLAGFAVLFARNFRSEWKSLRQSGLALLHALDRRPDRALGQLAREVEERDGRLLAADRDLRRLMAELGERDRKLVSADRDLRRLMAEVADRDARLVAADRDLRRLVRELEERSRELAEAGEAVRRLTAQLAEHGGEPGS